MAKVYASTDYKKVTVNLKYGSIMFSDGSTMSGGCKNTRMTIDKIRQCIVAHAEVWEILSSSTKIRLTFSNYDKDNSDYVYEEEEQQGGGIATATLNEKMKYCIDLCTGLRADYDKLMERNVSWTDPK